jgi:hypothetical protein
MPIADGKTYRDEIKDGLRIQAKNASTQIITFLLGLAQPANINVARKLRIDGRVAANYANYVNGAQHQTPGRHSRNWRNWRPQKQFSSLWLASFTYTFVRNRYENYMFVPGFRLPREIKHSVINLESRLFTST